MRSLLFCLFLLVSGVALADGGGYRALIPTFWAELYPQGGEELYCGRSFVRYDRQVNIEHVFPMAWVTKSLGCGQRSECRANSPLFNRIESDMHNMYPALRDLNKARGAMAYAEIPGENRVAPDCDLEIDTRRRRVEPRPAVRGDIARAMLYMAQRYDLKLYVRQRKQLLEWHHLDPPDAVEQRRNDVIERLQGQRNPYIDHADHSPGSP